MKRIHLFEFEDLNWFPDVLRVCMTRYINTIHKFLNSSSHIANILSGVMLSYEPRHIIDLCSGAGGPMPKVVELLRTKYGLADLRLTMSDLFPNLAVAENINGIKYPGIQYRTEPLNALDLDESGLRTLICSLHHMPPETARDILKQAFDSRQGIFVYEISDNSLPKWIWWMAIPINIISTFFITPFVRPMTWKQILFTYIIPVLPLCIAWDGAVSNARTYTIEDLELLLHGLDLVDYHWEKGAIKGRFGNKLYLLGYPNN